MISRSRPLFPLLLAALVGLAAVPATTPAVAAFFQSNIPIIKVPGDTTTPGGIPGTVETPTEPDPAPEAPDAADESETAEPPVFAANVNHASYRGEKLYLYVVLKDRFKDGARPERSMPGVIGKPWKAITKKDKQNFRFNLTSVAAGSEYYVVGIQKVGNKFKYLTRHSVRVNR